MCSAGTPSNILNPADNSALFGPTTFSASAPASSSFLSSFSSPPYTNSPPRFPLRDMAAAAVGLPPQAMSNQPRPDEPPAELPRPYKCPLCDKAFHRLEHQTRHIRTHTGEKPHACNFPGCSKRFSRSDELTRHSRIHANPNSRRGRAHHANSTSTAAAAAAVNGSLHDAHSMANVMGPPPLSWSNPGSNVASPNISPPQSYQRHGSSASTPYGSYSGSTGTSPEMHARVHQSGPANMNLLATAASQAAREHELSSVPLPNRGYALPPYSSPSQARTAPYYQSSTSGSAPRLPSLAAYHYSQPLSRSHSTEGEDPHYTHRTTKRSRPGSPYSTAPPSPSFSGGSHSPPSGLTPAITPGHSPHMHAHDAPYDNHLPGIRHLSLQHTLSPLIEPIEPSAEATGGIPTNQSHTPYSRSQNSSSSGLRISDIVNREDGSLRKLPVPNGSAS